MFPTTLLRRCLLFLIPLIAFSLIVKGSLQRWRSRVATVGLRMVLLNTNGGVNTSQLRNASYGRGGFEFALSYQNFNNKDNSTRNTVRCPVF